MPATPSATPSGVTPAQRREIYVEHTADADKADVFLHNLPAWLSDAELNTVQALKTAFDQAHVSHAKANQVLEKLKPLDVFCKEEMARFFKKKWAVDVDAERDTLEVVRRVIVALTTPFPVGFEAVNATTSRSLLEAAMENFTSEQTSDFSDKSYVRLNGISRLGTAITPSSFATLCRELDLGARYQQHIDDVFALPAKPVGNASLDATASAADVRRLKWLEMKIAIHLAYSKKHISAATYATMLSVVEQDVPAAKTKGALFDGGPILWQGLMIHDACICGALVFTKVSINAAPKAKCVVYMPNEPVRPLYEYDSLDDFKVYLTLKLQTKSYRKTFSQQYLPGHDKTDFFTAFDKDNTLGTLVATPAAVCLSDFFFSAFVSKTQKDARVLAVPTDDVDEEQWKKTLQRLLDDGWVLLNAASFFVPVLGQLMAVAAVVDIVSNVYEGVVDWTHGERNKALSHLLNVVESVAQMAAFAVGGKVLKNVLSKVAKEQTAFYDGFEAVAGNDGKARLWKPDLKPYQQPSPSAARQADSEGLYREGARTFVRMDGATYDVVRNANTQQWQIKHPERTDAFQPTLERNVEGGWRHLHEHAHEWPDSAYALQRTAPDLQGFSRSQLARIAEITDLSPAELFRRHDSKLKLPARVNDCIERFRLDERITRAITAMEAGQFANAEFAQEQLHTLPRLPGWPAKLVIEVHDEKGVVTSRFPESAAKTKGVNSVRVSQAQLDAGQLLETVSKSLYVKEVADIAGASTAETMPLLLGKKIASTLERDRRPLHDWLYESSGHLAGADVANLRAGAADVPVQAARRLLLEASTQDRVFLREHKYPGLDLAQQVSEMQSALRLDRALTGLHLPQLNNADTEKLSMGLMDRLPGWDEGFRLELRSKTPNGDVLGSAGKADAPFSGVIVKASDSYVFTQISGTRASAKTSKALVDLIPIALTANQRTRMGFSGATQANSILLRERLVAAATADPVRAGRIMRGEAIDETAHSSGCTQADPPVVTAYPRGMIRRVRKLYPLFTDAEVASFLDAAGETRQLRINRILALEQRWKTLRTTLHDWRNDEAGMKKLPGTFNDVQVSRRRVANAIENCWRQVKPPRWPAGQPYTTLKLERSPVGALPTLIEADVAHVRHLCIKDMEAGDELAYFLKPFKGLVRLELDGNQLTRLPEALAHMPNLEHLSLNRNKLALTEYTLRKLADMRKLKTLGLTGNRLGATIDVSKMFDLQSLFLGDTHATELPTGLSRLPYLDVVDLRGNDIKTLPSWLFTVSREFARRIDLRHNPLSAASRGQLKSYRDTYGVGMGFLEDDVAVIEEQKARDLWMPDSRETTYAASQRKWMALKNEPDSAGFFQLLAEVGSTADNRYAHEDMTRRVWSVIDAVSADSALREQLLPLAVKANCDDAAATIFSNIELAATTHTLVRESANSHDQAARLLKLGRQLFRQDYLATLAAEHIKSNPARDPVEVELAYRTGLADKLDLIGQPNHMRYAAIAGVKPADLEAAHSKVVTAELSPSLLEDLIGRAFWGDFLRQHHPRQFTDLAAPFHQRMETAFDTQKALGSGYRAHVDGIADELQKAEKGLLTRLTEEAMKAEDLKTCFNFD